MIEAVGKITSTLVDFFERKKNVDSTINPIMYFEYREVKKMINIPEGQHEKHFFVLF